MSALLFTVRLSRSVSAVSESSSIRALARRRSPSPRPGVHLTVRALADQGIGSFTRRASNPSFKRTASPPLNSNVRQVQNSALMQRLARFPVAVGSPAERGGKSVPGCSPCGSQRSVAAPRSIAAFLVRGGQRLSVVRHEFQGQHCLFPTFGAASSFCLSQTRAPNPAFERTGQRPAAQGQR